MKHRGSEYIGNGLPSDFKGGFTEVHEAVNDFYGGAENVRSTFYTAADTMADATTPEQVIASLKAAKRDNDAAGRRVVTFTKAMSRVKSAETVGGWVDKPKPIDPTKVIAKPNKYARFR